MKKLLKIGGIAVVVMGALLSLNFVNAQTTKPTITMTSPNEGEVWETGKTYDISWNSQGNFSDQDKITIHLARKADNDKGLSGWYFDYKSVIYLPETASDTKCDFIYNVEGKKVNDTCVGVKEGSLKLSLPSNFPGGEYDLILTCAKERGGDYCVENNAIKPIKIVKQNNTPQLWIKQLVPSIRNIKPGTTQATIASFDLDATLSSDDVKIHYLETILSLGGSRNNSGKNIIHDDVSKLSNCKIYYGDKIVGNGSNGLGNPNSGQNSFYLFGGNGFTIKKNTHSRLDLLCDVAKIPSTDNNFYQYDWKYNPSFLDVSYLNKNGISVQLGNINTIIQTKETGVIVSNKDESELFQPSPSPIPTSAICYKFNVNLTVGSYGQDVLELQEFLVTNGFKVFEGKDGYFGTTTARTLALYQQSVGIPNTGFFGPLTRASINNRPCNTVTTYTTKPVPVPVVEFVKEGVSVMATEGSAQFNITYKVTAKNGDLYIPASHTKPQIVYTVDKMGVDITQSLLSSKKISYVVVNQTNGQLTQAGNYYIPEGDSRIFTFSAVINKVDYGQYRLNLSALYYNLRDDLNADRIYTLSKPFSTAFVSAGSTGGGNLATSTPIVITEITSKGNRAKEFYAGDEVNISGSGFNSASYVSWNGANGTTIMPIVYTNNNVIFKAPNVAPGKYSVRIMEKAGNASSNIVYVTVLSRPTTTISPIPTTPIVKVLSPNGGETLYIDKELVVSFTPIIGAVHYINLVDESKKAGYDLGSLSGVAGASIIGQATDKQIFRANVSSISNYKIISGNKFKIEVCSKSQCDKSDNYFTVISSTPTTVSLPLTTPTPSISPSPSISVTPKISVSPSPSVYVSPTASPTTTYTTPRINRISPSSGVAGTTVTIEGVNFEGVDAYTIFLRNNIGGEINPDNVVVTSTRITFKVPNITYGTYSVSLFGDKGDSNTVNFTITAPQTNTSSVFDWFLSFFN